MLDMDKCEQQEYDNAERALQEKQVRPAFHSK